LEIININVDIAEILIVLVAEKNRLDYSPYTIFSELVSKLVEVSVAADNEGFFGLSNLLSIDIVANVNYFSSSATIKNRHPSFISLLP
jgi:hypothetical protein